MRPPARAIVGNLIWSTDGGVWAVWRVAPFAVGYLSPAARRPVQAHLQRLMRDLPTDSMILSVCERVHPLDVAAAMADGIDLLRRDGWSESCELTVDWLGRAPVYRRRHYVAAQLPSIRRPWRDLLRDAAADVGARFGVGPTPVSPEEVDVREAQADRVEATLRPHVRCEPLTAGETCWLYAHALRREAADPSFDATWEPPDEPHGVWARLTDAVVKEGGDEHDGAASPRQRRYVRIETPGGTAYQTVFALTDMPLRIHGGDGDEPGDWLYRADGAGFPVDWCVRVREVHGDDANLTEAASGRARPRSAGSRADDPFARLGEGNGNGNGGSGDSDEPERAVTVLLSVAAPDLTELEDRAGALGEMFEPEQYGLARPTRDQAALWRSMLPGTAPSPACDLYTQHMSAAELAGGAPFCNPDVGDPTGLLLGVSLDGGTGTPVLFDPTLGFRTPSTPSLAAVGDAGSGKSFLLKRLCWDTVARGGQVVAVDTTPEGEYARFSAGAPGEAQVLVLEPGAEVSLDPLRAGDDDERLGVALSFLSLLVGCGPDSDEAVELAQAIEAVADRPGAGLYDVVDELARRGAASRRSTAAGLTRRLTSHRGSPAGQLAFGPGRPPSLDTDLGADLVVLWLPELALPTAPTWHAAVAEQVLGQALLFLAVALAQRVARRDPTRFTATLCDGAGPLLASPHGQRLLVDAARDGQAHNAALWLASEHPDRLAVPELDHLLGPRFVFHQERPDIPAALAFLGLGDSPEAADTLDVGLEPGQCLFRDVNQRVGLVHVLPPLQPDLDALFEKVPGAGDEQPALGPAGDLDGLPVLPTLEPVELLTAPAGNTPTPASAPAVARQAARRRRRTPLGQALQEGGNPPT